MKIRKTYNTFVWICNVAKEVRLMVAALICIQLFQGIASISKALLLGQMVTYVVAGREKNFVLFLCIFVCIVVFQIGIGAVSRHLNESAMSEMENALKYRLMHSLLKSDYSEVANRHSEEWMNYLTSDTVVIASTFIKTIPEFVGFAMRLIGAVIALYYLCPMFLIFLLVGMCFIMSLTYGFRKILKNFHKEIQETDGSLRVFLQERISNLLIVKTFAQEKKTSILVDTHMDKHKKTRLKRNIFLNIFYSTYSIGINSMYILGIIFCCFGILKGNISYGNLIVILQLLEQIQVPFANITGFMPRYYAMIASAERLIEAESLKEDISNNDEELSEKFYHDKFYALGFKNVSFSYHKGYERQIIKNLSFEINKGEHVILTGPSGCGKSTVLKLLMGLYPLDNGEAYILEKNGYATLSTKCRKLFAYVPQGNQLLTGTIRESVAFGDDKEMKNETKIMWALKIACANDFVNLLKDGIETKIFEHGIGLSEGQIQRIAVARAVFSNRPILLLDEITSALDEKTAIQMFNNLKTMTDKTVIIVTHEKNSVKTYSKELVFSELGIIVK